MAKPAFQGPLQMTPRVVKAGGTVRQPKPQAPARLRGPLLPTPKVVGATKLVRRIS